MKRIVCIVLAVMMLAGMCGAVAESSDSGKEQALSTLEMAYVSYSVAPDRFDLELTLYAYATYKMFALREFMETSKMTSELGKMFEKEEIPGFMKILMTGPYKMLNAVDEDFEKWLNGEIDYTEFRELMMPVIKAVVDEYKDK